MTRVAVIGGGISGLAAAWEVARTLGQSVTLVEGSERLGGKIVTEPFAGIELDAGPDSFLARRPEAARLAQEAGLGEQLVAPGTGQAWLWARGRLRPLPTGLVLGVPADLPALVRSRVLNARATARAALDLIGPGARLAEDEDVAVGALVRSRMGRGVQMGLVDPLLGGINAGHTDRLSAAVAAPQLLAAARRHRSLARGLRAGGTAGTASGAVIDRPAVGGGPGEVGAAGTVFLTVRGGLDRLVRALDRGIREAPGSAVVLEDAATAIETGLARGWTVRLASGRSVDADAVVVACPAEPAARLLTAHSPAAATTLRSIETASVVLTALAYPRSALSVPPAGSGFLVPRPEGRLVTAASWVGAKWPHLDVPDQLIIRASSGRIDDDRAMRLADDEIIARIHTELAEAMCLTAAPTEARVHRWPAAFPQFEPGHLDRIAAAERRLAADAPGIVLAGAALRGVGIATCVAGGRAAGARAVDRIARPVR